MLEHCFEGETDCWFSIFRVFPSTCIPKASKDVSVHLFIHTTNSCKLHQRILELFEATMHDQITPCTTGQHIIIFEKFGTKNANNTPPHLRRLQQCHCCDKLNLVSTQQHNQELPLLQPCCLWNSSSSSAAVMRLEVGRARMEAVRGCTGVLQPPVPCPCW